MPAWPPTLPPIPQLGASFSRGDRTIRTQMDTGIADVRLVDIATAHPVSFPFKLNLFEMRRLIEFHEIDCNGGATPFTFRDPLDKVDKNYRFIGPITDYRVIEPAFQGGNQVWEVTVRMEEIP